MMFYCTGLRLVSLYVQDKAGNTNRMFQYIDIEYDSVAPQCIPSLCWDQEVNSSGSIHSEIGMNVPADIGIKPLGYSTDLTVFKNKSSFFESISLGGSYSISARKENNPKNGISTFDLVLLQRHILGVQLLNSPYKQIAADVNNSKTITTADLVYLRKMILGIVEIFPNGQSWEFMPASFKFTNPNKPLLEFDNTSNQIILSNIQKDTLGLDFIAIKKGDLNNSAYADAAPRNATPYLLEVPNPSFGQNERVEIPITALSNETLEGYQGMFLYDTKMLELVEIVGESDHFNVRENGKIAFSELGNPAPQVPLFTLIFRSKQAANLNQALQLSDETIRSEAYNSEGTTLPLTLTYKNATKTAEPFFLFPNPAQDIVMVFFAQLDAPTSLNLYNSLGERVYSKTIFDKLNNIDITNYPNGVYYCTIQQGVMQEVKKLLIAR